jgi:hypothetical protein
VHITLHAQRCVTRFVHALLLCGKQRTELATTSANVIALSALRRLRISDDLTVRRLYGITRALHVDRRQMYVSGA